MKNPAIFALLLTLVLVTSGKAQPDTQPLINPLPDPAPSNAGLVLEKFVTLPRSEPVSGELYDNRLMRHNRINHLSELPDGSGRMAVPDLNGPLYFLRDDGSYNVYLDFTEHFPDLHNHAGLGTGFGFVAFHPEYGENGLFYTVHTESGDALAEKDSDFPLFGNEGMHSIITRWQAEDPEADIFAGMSTEVMRIGFATQIHNIQQIGFNPTVSKNDLDYGMLYILVGDGGNGVDNDNPQDLATPHGTIFRIDPMESDGRTGEYGIPTDNPFIDTDGALPEIFAYGLRDPHRMSWDPSAGNRMFVGNIGELQVESLYEVQPGDNFGWSEREGPYRAQNRLLYPLPENDELLGYTYPVAAYDHNRDPGQRGDAGVAIAGGFVYRGDIDLLKGRYIFTDIVYGNVYSTWAGQLQRNGELATIESLRLMVDGEETSFGMLNADDDPDDGHDGRIDLRVGRDAEGELYLLSKGSGTIWRIVDAFVVPPHDNPAVLPRLNEYLVAYYDFDHPDPDNQQIETDRGLSGTAISLVNGGQAMRSTQNPAYPGAGNSLQTRQVDGENNDWKSGTFNSGGISTLGAFNQSDAMTIAGWFMQTGQNPSPEYGAVGLAGVLSGISEGHLVRALLEVFEVNGEQRLVALGRRLDNGTSLIYASDIAWNDLLSLNEWVHLAATFDFDTGNMKLYANGEELPGFYTSARNAWEVSDTEADFTSSTDPRGIKIGGSFPQNTAEQNPCNCRMDDLMFLNTVVSPEDMASQFTFFTRR